MNNTLENALAKVVSSTQAQGSKLLDFLYAQAPEVVEQLLAWKFVESLTSFILSILGFTLVPYIVYKLAKVAYTKLGEAYSDGVEVIPVVFGVALSLFSVIYSLFHVSWVWVQIWIAPKIYLLEYCSQIIK